MRKPSKQYAVLAILILGLLVRLIGITSRPLWYDEAFSVLFSEKGPAAMARGTLTVTGTAAADVHPLAYYTMLWGWMHTFGESLIAIRALSIIAGSATVLVIYLLARDLINRRTALAAALIIALSPFQVHYSQEVRMYVFLDLWLLLATYAYLRASESVGWRWWAAFAVFAALAQYTHNLAAFYLVALALWPLLRRDWHTVKSVLLAGIIAVLIYTPWLVHLPAQFAKVDQSYWVDRPGAYRLFTLLLYFVTNLPVPASQLAVALMISVMVVAIAALQTYKAARLRWPGVDAGLWLLYLAFFPAALLFVLSQWKPIYLERALLPSGTVFCAWLAWVLLETRLQRVMIGVMVVLLAMGFGLGLYSHVSYSGTPYAPYASLDATLSSSIQPGDAIVHSSKLSMLPLAYLDRALPQTYVGDPPGSPQDTLAPATQEVLTLVAQPDIQTAVGNARRVWFIIFDESIQQYVGAGYSTHPQLTWLSEHFPSVRERNWGPLHVYLFSRAP